MADGGAHPIHLYGIDPGSGKPWAVYQCSCTDGGGPVGFEYRDWPIADLDGLIDQVVGRAAGGHAVLLSIDAPLNRVSTFRQAGGGGGRIYPFNVNPFTVRPCERALMGKPGVVDRNLAFPRLVEMIAALCGWNREYNSAAGNRPYVETHEGVSVLGYMGAPHGPVVSLFVRRLGERHPDLSFSPRAASRPQAGRVYVLESHPAVSLGVWAADGRLGGLSTVPRYKTKSDAPLEGGLHRLRDPVCQLAAAGFEWEPPPPETDDVLDALVGLLNLLDLSAGRGDWFGCEALGYFLIPRFGRYPQGDGRPQAIGDAWEEAYLRLVGEL